MYKSLPFPRITYNNEKVMSVASLENVTKLDGYCPRYHHLKTKLDGNVSYPAAFLCQETVYQARYCSFLWHRINGICILNSLLMRSQVVFDNEHTFHLSKNRICALTVQR